MLTSSRLVPWAWGCMVGTWLMVMIGGATRLTESGLSIVEWQLFKGIFPPWTEADWQVLYKLYIQTPEFLKKNSTMDVAGFKSIFWLEYIHRLWGRLLGLAVIVPGCIFLVRVPEKRTLITGLLFGVIAQGIMGWMMVKSGLVHHPSVSPYRLCSHLCLALGLFLGFLHLALFPQKMSHPLKICWPIAGVGLCMGVTLCFGAFVAGLDAGWIYNTFPLMEGQWVPEHMWGMHPVWRNLFENPGTVQWVHRVGALGTLGVLLGVGSRARWSILPQEFQRTLVLALIQIGLGIGTLLWQVPLMLAVIHQCMAFILIGSVWVWMIRASIHLSLKAS